MKELAKEFEGEFSCPGENAEKYKTFSVLRKKVEKGISKMEKKLQKPFPAN